MFEIYHILCNDAVLRRGVRLVSSVHDVHIAVSVSGNDIWTLVSAT